MSKKQHQKAQGEIRKYLLSNHIKHHMFYGPANDQYWNEKAHIVAINMEPYGYEDSGVCSIDRDDLIEWIYDAGSTGTKTTRYTLAFISLVLSNIEKGITPTPDNCSEAYYDDDTIENTLDRSAYYNISPVSNSQKAQDFDTIASTGGTDLGKLIWEEIKALDPNVIIVSGVAGLVALNQMMQLETAIEYGDSVIHPDGFLVQSMRHFSRPSYEDWCLAVERIGKWIKEGI